MTVNGDKMRARIAALLSKTVENGATEAEALAAASKARELMDAHNISVTADDARDERAVILKTPLRRRDVLGVLLPAIGRFTDCTAWQSADGSANFCGAPMDADFAVWLLQSLARARDGELLRWRGTEAGQFARAEMTGEQVNRAFTLGFVELVRARLDAITQGREQSAAAAGSRALVVVKGALIRTAMDAAGIRLRSRSVSVARNDSARGAGNAAGDRAGLGRPVSGAGGPLRLR